MPVCEDVQGTGRDLRVDRPVRWPGCWPTCSIAVLRVGWVPTCCESITSGARPYRAWMPKTCWTSKSASPTWTLAALGDSTARSSGCTSSGHRTTATMCRRDAPTTRACGRSGSGPAGALDVDGDVNLHVRVPPARPTSVPPFLFRDRTCAHPEAIALNGAFKRSLAARAPDVDLNSEVKDPVVDLVIAVAEPWAAATVWNTGTVDPCCPVMVENAPVETTIERARCAFFRQFAWVTAGTPTRGVCSTTETCSRPLSWDSSNRGSPETSPGSVASSHAVSSSVVPSWSGLAWASSPSASAVRCSPA